MQLESNFIFVSECPFNIWQSSGLLCRRVKTPGGTMIFLVILVYDMVHFRKMQCWSRKKCPVHSVNQYLCHYMVYTHHMVYTQCGGWLKKYAFFNMKRSWFFCFQLPHLKPLKLVPIAHRQPHWGRSYGQLFSLSCLSSHYLWFQPLQSWRPWRVEQKEIRKFLLEWFCPNMVTFSLGLANIQCWIFLDSFVNSLVAPLCKTAGVGNASCSSSCCWFFCSSLHIDFLKYSPIILPSRTLEQEW